MACLALHRGKNEFIYRGVARGGQSPPPRNMADQLTLFKPRGADYAPHTTARHPRFQKAKYGSASIVVDSSAAAC